MRSNNIFNYVIYALLGVLFLSVAYYALEKRKEQAQKEEEMRRDREQLERSLADMNTVGDTAAGGQSAYVGETPKTTTTPAKANNNGIEDEGTAAATKQATTPAKTTAAPTTAPAKTTTTPAKTTAAPAPDPKLVAKTGATAPPKQSIAPSYGGRYWVVVGAFGQIANAREEMEKFVKMGYQDAEVVKHTNSLWRVVAKRCTTRAEAQKFEGDLERHGYDAMVVDSNKK